MLALQKHVSVSGDGAGDKGEYHDEELLPRRVAHGLGVLRKHQDLERAHAEHATQCRVKGVVADVRHGVFHELGRVVAGLGRRSFDGVQTFRFPHRQHAAALRTRLPGVRHEVDAAVAREVGVGELGQPHKVGAKHVAQLRRADVVAEAPQPALDAGRGVVGVAAQRDVHDWRAFCVAEQTGVERELGGGVPAAAAVSRRPHGHQCHAALSHRHSHDDILRVECVVVAGHAVVRVQQVEEQIQVDGGRIHHHG